MDGCRKTEARYGGGIKMAHVRKQQICFFLTTKCTLRCRYCYTLKGVDVQKEHRVLSLDFAKKAIDDFFRDYPSREIRFYGVGEPTVEFDLLKDIKNYAYELAGDSLKVELQTDGYFSENTAEWIAKNVDVLWMSVDGPPEVQDFQRPTASNNLSSKVVEQNLRFFVEQDNLQLGVRATITPLTLKRQMDIVEYFNDIGIKFVNAHPACAPVGGSSDPIFDIDPLDFAENFLNTHNKARRMGVFYNSLYIVNFDERTRFACRSCVPYPHITTDGYVSCCDFAQFGPKYAQGPLQQLIYGRYIPEKNEIVYDEEKFLR